MEGPLDDRAVSRGSPTRQQQTRPTSPTLGEGDDWRPDVPSLDYWCLVIFDHLSQNYLFLILAAICSDGIYPPFYTPP